MHVIWRDGLQDDDYLAAGHGRAPSCSASGCSRSIRPSGSRRSPGVDVATIETFARRLRPRAAVADPPQLRHAAPPRRRDGRADDRLPARDRRRVAAPRRRRPALDQRHLRLRHGPAHPPRPLAPRHPHDQHEPARRGTGRRAARPAGPGPLRLQLQPRRRRPQPAEGARGPAAATTCSPSSTSCSRPTPSTTPTSCCRPRRSSSTSTSTARTAITT